MKKSTSFPAYWFKPLSQHIDGGFGALGDEFHEAANSLNASADKSQFPRVSLPIAYLQRHAIELFLKSCIIIIHRALRVPFGHKQHGEPAIKSTKGWTALRRVHSIGLLYQYFAGLVKDQQEELGKKTETDWNSFLVKMDRNLIEIDDFDKTSTLFRYPGRGDAIKSAYRQSSVADIQSSIESGGEPVKAFLELDEQDNIVAAFRADRSQLLPIMSALREASDLLDTLHFALRLELGQGS